MTIAARAIRSRLTNLFLRAVPRVEVAAVKITLQQKNGCHSVHGSAAPVGTASGFAQHSYRLNGRQPFIQVLHWQPGPAAQTLTELFRVLRLRAFVAAHMQRMSDENRSHRLLFAKRSQLF